MEKYSIGIVNGKIDIIRKKRKTNIIRIPKDAKVISDTRVIKYHDRAQYIDCKLEGCDYCDKCGYTNR
jgi:hypothetical protein